MPSATVHPGGMFRSAGATIAGTKPQWVTRNKKTSTGGPRQVGDVLRALPDIGSRDPAAGTQRKASRPSDTEKQHAISAISASSLRPGQIPQADGDVSELGSRLGPKAALTREDSHPATSTRPPRLEKFGERLGEHLDGQGFQGSAIIFT